MSYTMAVVAGKECVDLGARWRAPLDSVFNVNHSFEGRFTNRYHRVDMTARPEDLLNSFISQST